MNCRPLLRARRPLGLILILAGASLATAGAAAAAETCILSTCASAWYTAWKSDGAIVYANYGSGGNSMTLAGGTVAVSIATPYGGNTEYCRYTKGSPWCSTRATYSGNAELVYGCATATTVTFDAYNLIHPVARERNSKCAA